VHVLLSCPPTLSPSKIMQYVKGKTSRKLMMEFKHVQKQYWGRHLWARGYFVATSGNVTDEAIAGSDAIATSLVLAKAIEKIGSVDLVVCGMASTDATMSVVPAMLAERLGLPQVTLASVIETQGDQVRVKRDGDTATEVIGGTLPLVLSVTDQSGEARYPSFKGIMAAKKKPMETLSLSDIGVDPGDVGLSVAWSEVSETTERPPRTAGEIVKDEDGSGATALTEFLASKKFI